MRGLLQHLLLTLRLNFRSKQALVYGYLVPIFFLIAFGSIFKTQPPLLREMGQLLVITTLGGACFGLPTAMVSERERGVWRRYRLLPAPNGMLVFSTFVARFVIVLTAALLQLLLAIWVYHMPAPALPGQLFVAYAFVVFAFLGIGLVIAMLSDTVPAVQALGQAIFLPMIIIGGVGVPLEALPHWGRQVAQYLPGYHAVKALDACIIPASASHGAIGLSSIGFELGALLVMGIAACLAGQRLFRWDAAQRVPIARRSWALLAIVPWALIGLASVARGHHAGEHIGEAEMSPLVKAVLGGKPSAAVTETAQQSATAPATAPTTNLAVAAAPTTTTAPATEPALADDWQSVTVAQENAVTYNDLESDESSVTPFAPNLDSIDDEAKKFLEDLRNKLADWKPAAEDDVPQRVRNVLSVAAVVDILQHPREAEVPLVCFDQLKNTVSLDDLKKSLTYIVEKPAEGSWVTKPDALGFEVELPQDAVRERGVLYAKKMLGRLLGKLPPPAPK